MLPNKKEDDSSVSEKREDDSFVSEKMPWIGIGIGVASGFIIYDIIKSIFRYLFEIIFN